MAHFCREKLDRIKGKICPVIFIENGVFNLGEPFKAKEEVLH
jgi:hypothetical protein